MNCSYQSFTKPNFNAYFNCCLSYNLHQTQTILISLIVHSQHQNDDLLGQVLYFYTFYACMQKLIYTNMTDRSNSSNQM